MRPRSSAIVADPHDERQDTMATVDFRTRYDGDAVELDPSAFLELFADLDPRRVLDAAGCAERLRLPPLTVEVDGEPVTFAPVDGRLQVQRRKADGVVAAMDRSAFSDLVQDVASTFWLHMTGRAKVRSGSVDAFVEWEPVLRCLLDGRRVYEPGTIELRDADGAPLDLHRSFHHDDDPDEI